MINRMDNTMKKNHRLSLITRLCRHKIYDNPEERVVIIGREMELEKWIHRYDITDEF